MKRELADFILWACANNDTIFSNRYAELPELREDYRGRDEAGPVAAIVCEEICLVMAAIACELAETQEAVSLDLSELASLRQDSMGRRTIFY
jgi:hypothetical protein